MEKKPHISSFDLLKAYRGKLWQDPVDQIRSQKEEQENSI